MEQARRQVRTELDWMFHNIEVSDDVLIANLIEVYFPGLVLFAAVLGGQPDKAKGVAEKLLSQAVANRWQFWGQQPFNVWLFSRALAEPPADNFCPPTTDPLWNAFQSLRIPLRTVLVLRGCLALSDDETAAVLAVSPGEVKRRFGQALDLLTEQLVLTCPGGLPEDKSIRQAAVLKNISASWRRRILEVDTSGASGGIARIVRAQRDRQRKRTFVKEASLLAGAILLFLAFAGRLGLTIPGSSPPQSVQSYQTVVVPQIILVEVTATPNPHISSLKQLNPFLLEAGKPFTSNSAPTWISVYRLRELGDLPPDLYVQPERASPASGLSVQITGSAQTGSPAASFLLEDVLQLVKKSPSSWETLSLNLEIYTYGPPNFVGSPQVDSIQVWTWTEEPFYWLGLIRRSDSGQEYLEYRYGSEYRLYQVDSRSKNLTLLPSWKEEIAFSVVNFIHSNLLALDARSFNLEGWEQVAGRQTAVLRDKTPESSSPERRIWVDAQTGVILRAQVWRAGRLVNEFVTREVEFDIPIPMMTGSHPSFPLLNYNQDETERTLLLSSDVPGAEPGHEPLPHRLRLQHKDLPAYLEPATMLP